MDERRVIVVHDIDDARTALTVAAELNKPVTLQSAPDALFYAGSLYLLHMFEQARSEVPQADAAFILDCADAGAEAVGALSMGHRLLRSSAPEEIRATLEDIAGQVGGRIITGTYETLDLRQAQDAAAACREWLSQY